MDYSKIIAVSGLQGLHELISSKNDGAIVRSLDDKSTRFVSSRIHNFSHLESIEIYTVRDNVNLVDILLAMQKSSKALPDTKDNAAIKKYFEAVYPDLDFDRVYSSDMKKIIKWFEILQANKIEIKLSEPVVEEEVPVAAVEEKAPAPVKEKPKAAKAVKEEVVEEAPKKKVVPKKKEAEAVAEVPEKPAKKAVAKATKAAKETKEVKKEEAPKKKAAPKKK